MIFVSPLFCIFLLLLFSFPLWSLLTFDSSLVSYIVVQCIVVQWLLTGVMYCCALLYGVVQILCDVVQLLYGVVQLLYGVVQLFHGVDPLLHGVVQLLHGVVQLLYGVV